MGKIKNALIDSLVFHDAEIVYADFSGKRYEIMFGPSDYGYFSISLNSYPDVVSLLKDNDWPVSTFNGMDALRIKIPKNGCLFPEIRINEEDGTVTMVDADHLSDLEGEYYYKNLTVKVRLIVPIAPKCGVWLENLSMDRFSSNNSVKENKNGEN